jgi:hypothetical protein
MVLYNVTLKIQNEVVAQWVEWMKCEHMPDLLQTGLFTGCRLFRLMEQDDTDGATYAAQYYCNSINEYHDYINRFAQEMRERGHAKFGGKFVAFRTIMEEV